MESNENNLKTNFMRIIKNFLIAFTTSALLAGCSVTLPMDVTDNEVGPKTGKASYTIVLGIPPFNGDAGIKSAAENGNIDKIATVDRKVKSGFFTTTITTVVTGK